jgi:pullulanase
MNFKLIDSRYYYYECDLGANYNKEETIFKLWAPYAKDVKLILCDDIFDMVRIEKGIWSIKIEEDLHAKFYNYYISLNGIDYEEVVDPYARSLSVNGVKGAIIDFTRTNPDNWNNYKPSFQNFTDAIIYELNIRDISIDDNSGIKNKGKYLGLSEIETYTKDGLKSGLSHIKELGITHIQLMPIYDFATVDETKEDDYNWGYDPLNFNSLEGSYSTDPYDPTTRIYELKKMIQTIHNEGLRVIMDVVYNHVYDIDNTNFEKIFPGYYFRKNDKNEFYDGSGCGNEIASERKMVRKFIIDSIVFWVKEYNLDGFRFDLMGLLDIETMNMIRIELDKIDPSIIMIGEGWEMGEALKFKDKACLWNAKYLPRIGQFNDDFRDGIRGHNFDGKSIGYIGGDFSKKISVLRGIVGGIEYSKKIKHLEDISPNQIVNYVEVHDNHTLYDKLKLSVDGNKSIKKRHLLGSAISILSQGITFIHSGQEIMKTKSFEHNSYNMGDEINKFDWDRKKEKLDVFHYIKGIIEIKKEHPSFRMKNCSEIKNKMKIINTEDSIIAYIIENDKDFWKNILVIHNASDKLKQIEIDSKLEWNVVVDKDLINLNGLKKIKGDIIEIAGLNTIIAYR